MLHIMNSFCLNIIQLFFAYVCYASGIWPESPSFRDEGIGEIPKRWKGVCMEGRDFKKSNCNRYLPFLYIYIYISFFMDKY